MKMKDVKRLYKNATRQLVQVGTEKRKVSNGFGDEVVDYPLLQWKKKPHDEGSLKQFVRRLFLNIPTSAERECSLRESSPKVRAIANTPLRKGVA